MADKSIGELPVSAGLDDAGLLVVEQENQAMSITGALVKQFARDGIQDYVEAAEAAAKDAETARKGAQTARTGAETAQAGAEESAVEASTSAISAEKARQAIEALGVTGVTLPAGQDVSVAKTVGPDGSVTLTFSIPQGDKGDTGDQGIQGVSIVSIQKTGGTGQPGSTDTYTITMSDGSRATFTVYNGLNGEGTGDMLAAIYDPRGLVQDIYAYADEVAQAAKDASRPNTWTPSAADVGAAPSSHAANHKTGGSDALAPGDIGAAATAHTHAAGDINSGTIAAARLPTATVAKGGTGRATLTAGSYLRGNGTGAIGMVTPDAVREDIGAAAKASQVAVILTAAGWADNAQTVSVAGALADEAQQAITVSPAPSSWEAAGAAMVRCTGQGDGTLTFGCRRAPAEDLTYHVLIQEVAG